MPTKDYDPIGEIIEAISAKHLWPVTKITTNTDGNITIGPGSIHDYDTATFSGTFAMEPIKTQISAKNGEYIKVGKEPLNPFAIRSVLSNRRKNAFTVVWEDGTTTVVHCQEGDEWDDEKALAMCFTKKALGNKGNFNDKFNDALDNKMKIIKSKEEIIKEEVGIWKERLSMGYGSVDCGVSTISDRIDEVEKKVDKVEKTIEKVEQSAEKTAKNFENMVKELTESMEEKTYELYLAGSFTNTKRLVHRGTISELRDFIRRYAVKADFGYYFRTWNAEGGMYLDYGSYTQYFFIPGMTNSEYSKN